MLSYIKKTVIVFAVSTGMLYAGTMGGPIPICVPGNSIVPCATTSWDVSIDALYLKPAYGDDLIYHGVINDNLISHQIAKKSSEWNWGVKLAGAYHFNTGNDLSLNWYHFDQLINKTVSFNVPTLGIEIPITYAIKPEWDALNLEFGQIINYEESKSFRLYGSIQYTRLAYEGHINLPPLITRQAIKFLRASGEVKYHGAGPRVGLNWYYNLREEFGLYADAALTLLIGDGKFYRTKYVNDNVVAIKRNSKNLIVPEFEGKAGAQLIYLIGPSYLSFNAGYMLVDFISGINSGSSPHVKGIYLLSGAYIGAKWAGSI
ncbi:major outer membrane protein [Legionella beliardensis]|uniref:Major outer membrane protein n=1 Tax=Legionella beliardensis TaxID=91822 RepID=A0A378I6E3_9GAMM|nr:Lpg1974 family pore-forming outer membrane protein [Legionella beliardensis]STX28034.1 major outer membrane protein [Legionella beliardensis]